jgi:Mor family transcriptional regulator
MPKTAIIDYASEICREYETNLVTISFLSQKFNTSPYQIRKILRNADISIRKNKINAEELIDVYYTVDIQCFKRGIITCLAQLFGCTKNTCHIILLKYHVVRRYIPKHINQLNMIKICHDRLNGVSAQNIAQEQGCSVTTINNIINKFGVIRPRSTKYENLKDILYEEYKLGASMNQLAVKYDITQSMVSRFLNKRKNELGAWLYYPTGMTPEQRKQCAENYNFIEEVLNIYG